MAKFKTGQSGNPKGRPKVARGFRAALLARYGDVGEKLVDRLEAVWELTGAEDRRVALAATELLLACLAGKPTTVIEAETSPIQMILTPEESRLEVRGPRETTP